MSSRVFLAIPATVGFLAATACATTGARDDAKKVAATSTPSASAASSSSSLNAQAESDASAAVAPSKDVAAFYPIVEGACPSTRGYRGAVRPARVHLTITYERGASAEGTFFEAFGEPLEIFDGDLR